MESEQELFLKQKKRMKLREEELVKRIHVVAGKTIIDLHFNAALNNFHGPHADVGGVLRVPGGVGGGMKGTCLIAV